MNESVYGAWESDSKKKYQKCQVLELALAAYDKVSSLKKFKS